MLRFFWVWGLAGLAACGARSDLSSGEDGAGAAGASSENEDDPDDRCPLPACSEPPCAGRVLVDDVSATWHAVRDGYLYFVVESGALAPGLYRLDPCGGEPSLLHGADSVGGIPAFVDGAIYLPVERPGRLVRLPRSGGEAIVIREYGAGQTERIRAVTHLPEVPDRLLLSVYSPVGGLSLLSTDLLGDDEDRLVAGLGDSDWAYPDNLFAPNQPVHIDVESRSNFGELLFLAHDLGIESIGSTSGQFRIYTSMPVYSPLHVLDGFVYFAGEVDIWRVPMVDPLEVEVGGMMPEPVMDLGRFGGVVVESDAIFYGENSDSESGLYSYVRRYDRGSQEKSYLAERWDDDWVRELTAGQASLYVRTRRQIVRLPKQAPPP